MIIVDFSQIMILTISAAANSFNNQLSEDMIRHIFLNNIAGYRKKYSKQFGDEMIIACDGRGYWRKEYFPYYKAKRAKGRAESPLDWDFVFNCINKIYSEIEEYFPYKIVRVDGCEGDDVIAVLIDYINKTRTKKSDNDFDAMFESSDEKEPILIISADKDFLQLQMYKNVRQYSPLKKTYISEDNAKYSRYEKILRGDAGDGIVNVFSDDDCFVVDGKRQKQATEKKLMPLLKGLMENDTLPEDTDYTIKRNFERNKKLIDLYDLQISKELYDNIVESYNSAAVAPRSNILKYFQKFQLKNLMNQIDNF